MRITALAIDIAKEKFYIFGVNQENQVVIDKALGRKKLLSFLGNLKPTQIFMEACAGSNYLCKTLNKMGHDARRISAQHVKPYASRQKNDRNDAKAILEASRRPGALFVSIKTSKQLDIQFLHKLRDQKMKQYKAVISQVRAFLFEYGLTVPKSVAGFKKNVPTLLENSSGQLSLVVASELKTLYSEFLILEKHVKELEHKIHQECEGEAFYHASISELKGVGPLVASKYMTVINHHSDFKNGRQASAHIGLVPRQFSSGGTIKLGRMTKAGDVGLRTLLIQGARASLATLWVKKALDSEEMRLKKEIEEKGFNKVSVKLANRNARRMWAIMKRSA